MQASRPASGRAAAARSSASARPGLGDGVVVQEQHPVGAALERPPDADVVAAGEAEVRAGADQLDVREALLDGARRSRRSSRCRRRSSSMPPSEASARGVSSPPFQLRTTATRFTPTGRSGRSSPPRPAVPSRRRSRSSAARSRGRSSRSRRCRRRRGRAGGRRAARRRPSARSRPWRPRRSGRRR